MTRKDYELIAKAIRGAEARVCADPEVKAEREQKRGVRRVAAHLADALAAANPAFDAQRFLTSCGYGA